MNNELNKGEIVEISLDNIIPNRFQPRLTFDEQSLNELAKSIKQHGIIQPLVLRKVGNKYEIIAGERRFKASYIAGLTKVPAVVIDLNDNESAEVAIVENLQRQDLSPIEEAKSYKKLLDRGYLTQEELAARMGKTQATISNKLRLLNLAPEVQEALLNNKISERHARSLLRLDSQDEQVKMLDEIINKRLNVKLTEEAIDAKLKGEKLEVPEPKIVTGSNEPEELGIPTITPIEEPEIVQKDKFINPTFNLNKEAPIEVKDEVQEETVNPIPFIRPVIEDTQPTIEPDEDLIKPLVTEIKEDILPINNYSEKNIQTVENKLNNIVDEIKAMGFEAKIEEYDFENLYQFVIKVDKK